MFTRSGQHSVNEAIKDENTERYLPGRTYNRQHRDDDVNEEERPDALMLKSSVIVSG